MKNWGIGGVLFVALAAYGCDTANGGPIGEGGFGGDGGSAGDGGGGGMGGSAGDGGGGGMGGSAGDGGAGGMGGSAGDGGAGGMGGAAGMGGSAGDGGGGGMGGAAGMGGVAGMGGAAGVGGVGGMPPLASSCLDLLNAGETTDGIYAIEVGGNPLDVYCDMTRFGGGWTQLYDQDVAQGYLPTATWAGGVNTTQPDSGQYSILNLIDDFEGSVPGFEFFIDWPFPPPTITLTWIRWFQSLNPFSGRGIVAIASEAPFNQVGCSDFGGLASEADGLATLNGSTNFCAWWAIGTTRSWADGIPAYENSDSGQLVATRARLWVR
jgi:hypothetical protein